jgi:predicted MFS family arabinose efflux permease
MTSQDGLESRAGRYRLSDGAYAWILFALSTVLLLSDYMARQVLNAVFPVLRQDWALSDAQLGTLSGIVAVMVGLLTFPLSLAADRFGRIRAIVAMALLWSLATLACGLAQSYGQMLVARVFVGVGEAAYGSVGVAVLMSVFPERRRATISGAFMAGGALGSVLGVALGAQVAVAFGWRTAFYAMAATAVLPAMIYLAIARPEQDRPDNARGGAPGFSFASLLRLKSQLFGAPVLVFTYLGSGLQFFVASAFIAWLPSYFNRVYGLDTAQAGAKAALFLLLGAIGMVACSIAADRAAQRSRPRKLSFAIGYALLSFVAFSAAFLLPPGSAQLSLLGVGMFFVAGVGGAAGAVVVNCTDATIHATALATVALANNILGLASGPIVTGVLADHLGLTAALQIAPAAGLAAAVALGFARKHYARDYARFQARRR